MLKRRCPACGEEVCSGVRACGACGCELSSDSMAPTVARPTEGARDPRPIASPSASPSSPGVLEKGGLAPGAILGGRFRIVSPLGRGGMGVVYRADDLKLGQTVALKLLPPALAADPASRATLTDEVRIARQVSHPNVCRVFDIGEAEGRTFLSMEWVDGEDLASLVRRIGRLPSAKAVEIAHQVCAGLSAAHERGVVHRDLKPANVLLDGDGQALVSDFGLAVLTSGDARAAVSAGTPAYMAPEQLRGEPATVRSDVWGLGALLYELFAGHRAFRAENFEALRAAHAKGPAPLSTSAPDVDAAVEEVILRCLRVDPSERPASALEVSAALPGGDPLRAAVAAGRTPHPDVVAAAGGKGTLTPAAAWSLLAGTVAALALGLWAAQRTSPLALSPPQKSPEVLAERSREVIAALGLPSDPVDRAVSFAWGDKAPSLVFVYRQGPRLLIPRGASGRPRAADPAHDVPGMVSLALDRVGRLRSLLAVPPIARAGPPAVAAPGAEAPWAELLTEAGLDPASLREVPPRRLPPVPFDRRVAFVGRAGKAGEASIEVTAASFDRRPVFFEVIPAGSEPPIPWLTLPPARRPAIVPTAFTVVTIAMWVAFAFLARRNLRLGRGDRRGAFRLAGSFFAAATVSCILGLHWVPDAQAVFFRLFRPVAASSLVSAVLLWLFYLAAEPYARRSWPTLFISWNRALAGRFRDPLVGRDVLGGILGAALVFGGYRLLSLLPAGAPGFLKARNPVDLDGLLGLAPFLSSATWVLAFNIAVPLIYLAVLVATKALVLRTPLALVLSVILATPAVVQLHGIEPMASLALSLAIYVLIFRLGTLLVAVLSAGTALLASLPMALDAPGWVVQPTVFGLLILLAAAVWGFAVSLGGQPILGRAALED